MANKEYKQFYVQEGLIIDRGPEDAWKKDRTPKVGKHYTLKTNGAGSYTGAVVAVEEDPKLKKTWVTIATTTGMTHIFLESIIVIIENKQEVKHE